MRAVRCQDGTIVPHQADRALGESRPNRDTTATWAQRFVPAITDSIAVDFDITCGRRRNEPDWGEHFGVNCR
jgi:hypothetical protein